MMIRTRSRDDELRVTIKSYGRRQDTGRWELWKHRIKDGQLADDRLTELRTILPALEAGALPHSRKNIL